MSSSRGTEALHDEIDFLQFELRDLWQRLENYLFADETPLDGFTVDEAVEFILRAAGIPETNHLGGAGWELEPTGVLLSAGEGPGSRGDWLCKIEIGDSAAEWIQRLHDDYCGTWFYGFVPTADGIVFRFVSPEAMGEESVLTLYNQVADVPESDQNEWRHVYRQLDEHSIDPEANRIVVTGLDMRRRRPIFARYDDSDNQDPTVSVPDRSEDWLGEIRLYGYRSPGLASQELCDAALNVLKARLLYRRYLVEIECDLLLHPDSNILLWRGDVITLHRRNNDGNVTEHRYRILSFTARFESEPRLLSDEERGEDPTPYQGGWRPARYVLERIREDTATPTAQGLGDNLWATTLDEIRRLTSGGLGYRVFDSRQMDTELKRPAVTLVP